MDMYYPSYTVVTTVHFWKQAVSSLLSMHNFMQELHCVWFYL